LVAAFSAHRLSPLSTTRLYATDDSSSSKERKPWDIFRFVSQSSKFIKPPQIPFLASPSNTVKKRVAPGETLWTPSSSQNLFNFAPLDDVVMGGASSSTVDNNTGLWRGTVTDANNGGFVGIRSTPFKNGLSLNMSSCKGVELRLRLGDGKRFKFVVRDDTSFNGICWTTEFDATAGEGGNGLAGLIGTSARNESNDKNTTIRIPFANQTPTIFARTVSGNTFDVTNVVGFQVAYSKFAFDNELNQNFELGDFALQILEVRTY